MLVNKGLLGKQAFYDLPWFQGSERADVVFLTNATFKDVIAVMEKLTEITLWFFFLYYKYSVQYLQSFHSSFKISTSMSENGIIWQISHRQKRTAFKLKVQC